MKKRIKSKEKLECIRAYLDKWNLPISDIEKEMLFTPSQKAYLLHEIEIYDVLENEEYDSTLRHEIIYSSPMTGAEQIELFKKLNDLCPDLRKNLQKSHKEIARLRKKIHPFLKREYLYESLLEISDENMNINEYLISKGFLPCNARQIVSQFYKYKQLKEDYERAKQIYFQYLDELNIFRKEHIEYDQYTEQLVRANVNLVNWCIKENFWGIEYPNDEAKACGLEGLSKAIMFYDVESGHQFSSFAVPVIRRTIYIHRNQIKRDYQSISLENMFYEEEFLNAHEEYPLTFEDYEEIDQREDEFIESLFYKENYEGASPITLYEEKSLKEIIQNIVASMQEKDQALLDYLFGLTGGKLHNPEQAARYFGCSRQNIDQLLKRIRRNLKKEHGELLKDYLYDTLREYQEIRKTDYEQAIIKLYYLKKHNLSVSTCAFFISTKILPWTEEEVRQALRFIEIVKKEAFWIACDKVKEELGDGYPYHFPLIPMVCQIKKLEENSKTLSKS